MKDFKGNELKVGDEVIFVLKMTNGKGAIQLNEGTIARFHAGNAYIQLKGTDDVWNQWGCKGKCIIKL